MGTIRQEREALTKIINIISELEDSYIKTAFDVCLGDAEENTEFTATEVDKLNKEITQLNDIIKELKADGDRYYDNWQSAYEEMDQLRKDLADKDREIIELKAKLYDLITAK